jgi:hypothetical protein
MHHVIIGKLTKEETIAKQEINPFLILCIKLLWTGLVRGKARKAGYNQAGKYKTRQDRTILED